jgi:hypothetical protein
VPTGPAPALLTAINGARSRRVRGLQIRPRVMMGEHQQSESAGTSMKPTTARAKKTVAGTSMKPSTARAEKTEGRTGGTAGARAVPRPDVNELLVSCSQV